MESGVLPGVRCESGLQLVLPHVRQCRGGAVVHRGVAAIVRQRGQHPLARGVHQIHFLAPTLQLHDLSSDLPSQFYSVGIVK